MQCASPIRIKNPYNEVYDTETKSKVNMPVPCGYCGACKYNKRVQWTYRLQWESHNATSSYFITLTYNEENIPHVYHKDQLIYTLDKDELQRFIKRLRKHDYKISKQNNIRYFAIGEYGTRFNRPHYHLLLFNATSDTIRNIPTIWGMGFTKQDIISPARVHYITKFHVLKNKLSDDYYQPEFSLMSRRPGIGHQFLQVNGQRIKDNMLNYVHKNEFKIPLPRYYKDKIYTDEEKAIIRNETFKHLQKSEAIEYRRLKNLGIQNIKEYIRKSRIDTAKKVVTKQIKRSQNKDTF